jgi:hypothetical protein
MKRLFLIALVFLFSLPAFAQDEKPLVKVESFTFEGLGPEESRIIETLFQSYLNTLGTLVYPMEIDGVEVLVRGGSVVSETEIVPDFTFSGRVIFDQDVRHLRVTISNTHTGDVSSFSSTYRTTGELVLKARAFVESALSVGNFNLTTLGTAASPPENAANNAAETAKAEPLSERSVTGMWRGDLGIELVRLQRDGRGIAVFSSGAQMPLIYRIRDNTLFISQNSPNTERYYHPAPYAVARILAAASEPMRWEFLLYDNGATLRGIRIITAARYEGDRVLELTPNSAQETEWAKTR